MFNWFEFFLEVLVGGFIVWDVFILFFFYGSGVGYICIDV